MVNSIDIIRNVFVSPVDAFIGIKADPAWRVPGLLIVIISILTGLFREPFLQKIMVDRLVNQFGAGRATDVLMLYHGSEYFTIVATPFVIFCKCVLLSIVLLYAAQLFNSSHHSLNSLMSVVVHAELILLLMGIVNMVLVVAKGTNAVHSVSDLQPILGLEYVFRSYISNGAVLQLLKSVNIFTVWYIGVLVYGVTTICEIRIWQSSSIVMLIWAAFSMIKMMLT